MVYKIIEHKYGVIVESLILTCVIFVLGFAIGYYTESYRTGKIIDSYRENEVTSLDLKLQNYYYQILSNTQCDNAVQQNLIFADKVYDEGLALEKYEEANQITQDILIEKKRYVLLKTELWLNSIILKQKCSNPFDTVVYFYSNNPGSSAVVSEQKIISNVLKDVKNKKGNKIILIPIAADMGLDIVDLQLRSYSISSLPSILINENKTLEGYHSAEEIEKLLRN